MNLFSVMYRIGLKSAFRTEKKKRNMLCLIVVVYLYVYIESQKYIHMTENRYRYWPLILIGDRYWLSIGENHLAHLDPKTSMEKKGNCKQELTWSKKRDTERSLIPMMKSKWFQIPIMPSLIEIYCTWCFHEQNCLMLKRDWQWQCSLYNTCPV